MNESFKVGQKVRCVREDSYGDQIAFPGDVMTVTDPNHTERLFWATLNGLEFAGYKDRFEAVEEPKAAFKVGDRVRVVTNRPAFNASHRRGDVGDVTSISESGRSVGVRLDETASMVGHRCKFQLVSPDDIELIPTPATETPATDKVLEWLKTKRRENLGWDGCSEHNDGYMAAVDAALRDLFGLEVKTIPASVEFVAVPKAQPEFAFMS